jgi:hypothetical protein
MQKKNILVYYLLFLIIMIASHSRRSFNLKFLSNMKKTFLKSVATGIIGLTLVGGCSMFSKEAAHKCSASGCKAKKDANSCKGKNSCSAAKEAAHKCSANGCKGNK